MFKFNFFANAEKKEQPKTVVPSVVRRGGADGGPAAAADQPQASAADAAATAVQGYERIPEEQAALMNTLNLGAIKHEVREYIPGRAIGASSRDAEAVGKVAKTSDVLAGVYEGGLKQWECSQDLLDFLKDSVHSPTPQGVDASRLAGARVVDLGCGQGLPGIYCVLRGAGCVVFQDLNEEVLSAATAPKLMEVAGMRPVVRPPRPSPLSSVAAAAADAAADSAAVGAGVGVVGSAGSDPKAATLDAAGAPSDVSGASSPHDGAADSVGQPLPDTAEAADAPIDPIATRAALRARLQAKAAAGSAPRLETSADAHTAARLTKYAELLAMIADDEGDVDDEIVAFVARIEEEMKEEEEQKAAASASASASAPDSAGTSAAAASALAAAATSAATAAAALLSPSPYVKTQAQFIAGDWRDPALSAAMLNAHCGPLMAAATSSVAATAMATSSSVPAPGTTSPALKWTVKVEAPRAPAAGGQEAGCLPGRDLMHLVYVGCAAVAPSASATSRSAGATSDGSEAAAAPALRLAPGAAPAVCCAWLFVPTVPGRAPRLVAYDPSFPSSPSSPSLSAGDGGNSSSSAAPVAPAAAQWQSEPAALVAIADVALAFLARSSAPAAGPAAAPVATAAAEGRDAQQPPHQQAPAVESLLVSPIFVPAMLGLGFAPAGWEAPATRRAPTGAPAGADAKEPEAAAAAAAASSIAGPSRALVKLFASVASGAAGASEEDAPATSHRRFDLILSADTLYFKDTYDALIRTIKTILHRDGVALIAAKRYYFGVGGSTADFRQVVAKHGGLSVTTLRTIQDKTSNIREILAVRWSR